MKKESVHLMDFPKIIDFQENIELINKMDKVRAICSSALFLRDKFNLRVRLPLNEIKIIGEDLENLKEFEAVILDELNIKKLTIENNIKEKAEIKLQLNFSKIGEKYGSKIPELMKAVKTNNYKIENNILYVSDLKLDTNYFDLKLIPLHPENSAIVENYNILIELDKNITKDLEYEGLARDLVRTIQQNRKDANLNISDKIYASIFVENNDLVEAIAQNISYIQEQTLIKDLKINKDFEKNSSDIFSFDNEINGNKIKVKLTLNF